jgi:type VI secretion system protein ImpB
MSGTGSGHIKRNRPPRVQIAYQDPYDSEKMVELPFVTGVMADLSGNNSEVDKPEMDEREFRPVTKNTIDEFMDSIKPGLSLDVEDRVSDTQGQRLGIELKFRKMKDLEPAAIASQVPAMNELLARRKHLAELKRYLNSKPKAQARVKELLNDPDLLKALNDSLDET